MDDNKYRSISYALLRLWMENILTDGEYNKIMDRLNERYKQERSE